MDLTEREDDTLRILQSSENYGFEVNCCCSQFTNIICSSSAEVKTCGRAKLKDKTVGKCVMNHIILSWAAWFAERRDVFLD